MVSARKRGRPVEDGLYTWPSDVPSLIGGECQACGTVGFPARPSCARCGASGVETRLLSRRGRLWTWTVQRFEPKSPYVGSPPFQPFGVGYVVLEDGLAVESRLTEADPERLEIGMLMDLRIVPFATDESDETLLTFAFAPAADS